MFEAFYLCVYNITTRLHSWHWEVHSKNSVENNSYYWPAGSHRVFCYTTLALFCKANLNIPHFVYPLGKCFIKLLTLTKNNVFSSSHISTISWHGEKFTLQSISFLSCIEEKRRYIYIMLTGRILNIYKFISDRSNIF